jgi:small conductance mechanosensitive channel
MPDPVQPAPASSSIGQAVSHAELLFDKYGVPAIKVIVILVVAWLVSSWLQRTVLRGLQRAKFDVTLSKFISNCARWVVLVFAIIGCVSVFGVDTTGFAAVLGASSLAIGLALQGSLSNLAAGVMLLIFRPFKVGDTISVGGQTGTVDEIELFTTRLDTGDNRRIIMPNAAIFGQTIDNITHHPVRRADISVGVDYAANIDRTREVLTRAVNSIQGRDPDRAPAVVLTDLGASSVNWQVQIWASRAQLGQVKQDTIRAIKLALDEAAIGIPFPQMDIRLLGSGVAIAPLADAAR